MTETPAVDPCLCPLCGQPNRCAMAVRPSGARDGDAAPACWCVPLAFSPALLQQVPPQALRKACICQACVQAHDRTQAGA